MIGGSRRAALLILLAVTLVAAASCGGPNMRGIVKIGLVAPFGGSDYATGVQILFAARLALREWSARGGVGGYRVMLQAEDDHNDAEQGERRARAMTVDPAVLGVLGHVTAESATAGAPRYGEAGLALITFGNVTDWSELPGSFTTFRLTPSPREIARALGMAVAERLKARSAVLVHEPGRANEAFAEAMTEELRSTGTASVRRVVVTVVQSRYDAAARGIAEARPDVVILATNFVTAGEIAAALRPLSDAPILLAPQAERPAILRIGGESLEGAHLLAPAPYPGEQGPARAFVEAYQEIAGTAPTNQAALAYDAVYLLLSAAQRQAQRDGRVDRAGTLRELARADPLEGITGRIAFDDQRARREAQMFVYRVTGSRYPGELLGRVSAH